MRETNMSVEERLNRAGFRRVPAVLCVIIIR